MNKHCFLWLLVGLMAQVGVAQVRLPKLVGNHMVLQQNTPLPIWGWASPGEKVTVQFLNQKLSSKAGKDGKWQVKLAPLKAGGPHQMTIQGKNKIQVTDILVGEVWLASGQSNMEWQLKSNVNNAQKEIANANYPQIRLINVVNEFALQPQETFESPGWRVCSPQTAGDFSAVAYFFARDLYQKYQVPIGLISSEWGGTPAETWVSGATLKKFPEFAQRVNNLENDQSNLVKRVNDYHAQQKAWAKSLGAKDRGYLPNGKTWADADLPDASAWPTMPVPGLWENSALPGYDGVVWLRKVVQIPASAAGKNLTLSLGAVDDIDSTYLNGKLIGHTAGYNKRRVYQVPGELVKAGPNVIAVRVIDNTGGGGFHGNDDEFFAEIGATRIPLTGAWNYQTAVDVAGMPKPPVGNINLQNEPTALYNAMIAPLIPYPIKGAIWYQGESNAGRAYQYRSLFSALIQDWRKQWGYDFPFLFVQLANYMHDQDQPTDYEWAELREAQAMALKLPNTGMAVTIDVGDPDDIHPLNKQDVGKRLALAAQKVAYQDPNVVFSGPTFQSMSVEGNKVRVKMANMGSGLDVRDKYGYVRGFAIAGPDKKFVWAQGYQNGNDLILHSPEVPNPIAIRYNWGNSPDGNVYNKEGLPAGPFRTDDWPGLTVSKK